MRNALPAIAAACLLIGSPAHAIDPPGAILTAIDSPDRPQADKDRDTNRKPAPLLALAGIKPGDQVADLLPGQGYFTRLFSKIAGPSGKVYAVVPAELVQVSPKAADGVKAISAEPGYANVVPVVTPTLVLALPEPVDLAWTSDNYHDIYGRYGAAQAAAFDKAVFKILRPGGSFVVIDHAARPGTSDTSPKSLHRIDPATVKAQVLAAGFVLVSESDVLRNAADPHDVPVFDPSVRGRTDQFVFVFRKPAN